MRAHRAPRFFQKGCGWGTAGFSGPKRFPGRIHAVLPFPEARVKTVISERAPSRTGGPQ